MTKNADKEAQRESPFYTEERWNNWLKAVRKSNFSFEEINEDTPPLSMNIEEDVLLACNKLLASVRSRKLTKKKSLEMLDEMKSVVLSPFESMGKDKDLLLSSVQGTLMGAFAACEKLLKTKKLGRSPPLENLVGEALQMESEGKLDEALDTVSFIGARMLSGEYIEGELSDELPYSQVGEWLGSIEFMAVMETDV